MRAFFQGRLVEGASFRQGNLTVDERRYAIVPLAAAPGALNPVRIDLNALHRQSYGLEPARSACVPRSAAELNELHKKHYGPR